MEFGGVSVPGRNARTDGAYLLKDLSAFETQLGGLTAFIMVSDGTGDGPGSDLAAQLAVKAADTYLGSILRGIATGQAPVVEPIATLKAIVTAANTAVMNEAAEVGGSDVEATFAGAFVSADRVWFGRIGGGAAYLLRGDEARELVVEGPPDDSAPAALGHEGVRIEVDSADLSAGDVVVLLGRQASAVLDASDIHTITCAACDARVAAADLASSTAEYEPERSVTLAIWSSDSSLFTPVPPPAEAAPVVVFAANNDVSGGFRAEKIFLWVMSALIVVEVLALVVMAFLSRPSSAMKTADTKAPVAVEATTLPAPAPAVTATATAVAPPAQAEQPEYPKTLTVPKSVKGGLWLRKKATTLGGTNLVIQLKGGAKVEATDIEEYTDASGKTQEFYVFKVSDLHSAQVVETDAHPWPPSKSIETVYGFAKSFETP